MRAAAACISVEHLTVAPCLQARNRTRRVLTSFFKDRDCSTLVRPVDDEGKLQLIDSLTDDELRPEFRRQMAELRERITSEVRR